eukprot:XP_011664737.1 PREDICTED: lysyl oxidase homolog 2-like [Strongylocentrotus purpuratus]
MDRERFISWPCVLIFLLPFCQIGALQNVPPPGVALGMESGAIQDSSVTASYVNLGYGPERGRLNIDSAWFGGTSAKSSWIQVDLSTTYRITGVATQGRWDVAQWVTSFKVACSIDGITFDIVQDALNQPVADKVFVGNTDANTVVYNTLPSVKVCRYVRLLPITYHSAVMLRMELYGEGPVPENLEAGPIISLLHGNAPGEGFVLKDDGSSSGFLCGESWNLQSAEVACRMLGFIGIESFSQRVVSSIPFDPISVQVLRDGYICSGREHTLSECTSVTNYPSCTTAAGVVCTNNIVRLSGYSLRQYGHVEMYTNKTGWGLVCAQDWDDQDGQVICRMLGYPGMSRRSSIGVPTSDSTPITIGGLTCVGNEASIEECMYDAGHNIACGIDKVALLRCQNAVRLVGTCESEGRVEVYQHGSWGPVCDDIFTVADATIVCQMLGLQLVELLDWYVLPSVVSSNSATLKNPWCGGNETDIRYCMQEPNATCNKYAAVKCSDPLNLCAGSFGEY